MNSDSTPPVLSRPEASAAVEALGWRVVLGTLLAGVPVESLVTGLDATQVAAARRASKRWGACHLARAVS